MTTRRIEVETNRPRFTERVSLDGVTYRLTFRWNDRAPAWLVDIASEDGTMVVSGRRLAVNNLLTRQFRHLPALPPGHMMAFDTTLRASDPGLTDLGTRVIMLYAEAADVEAAQ